MSLLFDGCPTFSVSVPICLMCHVYPYSLNNHSVLPPLQVLLCWLTYIWLDPRVNDPLRRLDQKGEGTELGWEVMTGAVKPRSWCVLSDHVHWGQRLPVLAPTSWHLCQSDWWPMICIHVSLPNASVEILTFKLRLLGGEACGRWSGMELSWVGSGSL